MPEPDVIERHNCRQLDAAATRLVELGQAAVGKNPFGTLTLRLEWRLGVLTRLTVNEEFSELTPTPGAG